MNDKDRDLLIQALQQVGRVGEAGYHALVRWQFIDGLTTVLTDSLIIALAAWSAKKLFQWKIADSYDDELRRFFRGLGIVVCIGLIALVLGMGIQPGLRDMISPDGAAVAWLTAHK